MNLGIDIGANKTVIFSTIDNGSIVTDEFGKREIPTVLELSTPIRSFGKGVSGDSIKNFMNRRRGFFSNLKDEKNQESLYMFLEYLSRTIKLNYKNAALCVPEYFDESELRILKSLTDNSNLRIEAFMSHLTGVAAAACLRNASIQDTFMIIDCGFNKTSIGIFEFKDSKLTPKSRFSIKKGAADFDEVIYKILIKNYNLPDDSITREKIFLEVNKIKRGLNTLDSVKSHILSDNFETIPIEITRSEFSEGVKDIVSEIDAFVKKVFEQTKFTGYIEVVGNNHNSSLIQKILEPYSYLTTLNPSETAALGACLGFAVNSRKMQFKIEEISGRVYTMRPQGENIAPVVVFDNSSIIDSVVNVKYNRSEAFAIEVFENGNLIGLIKVNKPTTEQPEIIKVGVKINKFLLFDVTSVISKQDSNSNESNIEFTFETFSLGQDRVEAIKAFEAKYYLVESDIMKTAELRNSTEVFLDTFDNIINKLFPGLITSDEMSKIDEIRDVFFDTTTGSFEVELERRKKIFEELAFLESKLKQKETEIRSEAKALKDSIKQYISSNELTGAFLLKTPNFKALDWNLGLFDKELKLDLESCLKYDKNVLDKFKQDTMNYIMIYNNLVEEQKKKQAETNAKDNAACCSNNNCCQDNQAECCNNEEFDCCDDKGCCGEEGNCCETENCCSGKGCCFNEENDCCRTNNCCKESECNDFKEDS